MAVHTWIVKTGGGRLLRQGECRTTWAADGALVSTLRIMSAADHYVRRLVSSKTFPPDGSVTTSRDLAVWTLAPRGYSGGRRLDVWVYPTRAAALAAGADLAM